MFSTAETTVKAVFICTETNLTLLLHSQTSYHSARMISCLGKLRLGGIYQVGRDGNNSGVGAPSNHRHTDLLCPHLAQVYYIFIALRAAGSQIVLMVL